MFIEEGFPTLINRFLVWNMIENANIISCFHTSACKWYHNPTLLIFPPTPISYGKCFSFYGEKPYIDRIPTKNRRVNLLNQNQSYKSDHLLYINWENTI